MYVVKALGNATAPDFPGSNVEWTPGQIKYVHESLIEQYRNNPGAWEIVATSDAAPVSSIVDPLTGEIEFPGLFSFLSEAGKYYAIEILGQSYGLVRTCTWATKPVATTMPGLTIYVSDVGIGGSMWRSDGTRWRAVGGSVRLPVTLSVGQNVTNIVCAESLIRAGVMQAGDELVCRWSAIKSGTSETATIRQYVGAVSNTIGTTTNFSTGAMSTTNIRANAEWSLQRVSSTSVQGVAINGSVGFGVATGDTTAATVSNLDSVDQYLQLGCQMSAAVETLTFRSVDVSIITCGA